MSRALIFGEVLFDHFPDGSAVLGGAPFNVAWHLHAFGLRPLMVTRIGQDQAGRQIETAMRGWGMDCTGLQRDGRHSTGAVQVAIDDGEPAYDIVDQVAYDHIDAGLLPALDGDWLLYHGSLALRHECSAAALDELKQRSRAPCFVDINLRPPWWEREEMLALLNGAAIAKLNEQELCDLFSDIVEREARIERLAGMLGKRLVLTGGERGAVAIDCGDGTSCSVTPEASNAIVDTVGAGDAFCSVLLAGELLGWPLALTLERAQQFASGVVGIRGAVSQEPDFYRRFTRRWNMEESHDV